MKLYSALWTALVAGALLLVAAVAPMPERPSDRDDPFVLDVGSLAWDPGDSRVSDPDALFPGAIKSLYEASAAIDPTDPRVVLAWGIDLSAANADPGLYSTNRYYRSTDGGATWADMGPMPFAVGELWGGGDPVGLFTPDGRAYFASLAGAPDGSVGGIYVHRSEDGGLTWEAPVLAVRETSNGETCSGTDKEWLSHDAATDTLYLAYSLFEYACAAPPVVGDPTGGILRMQGMTLRLTRSADGGTTWSEPTIVQEGYRIGAMPRTDSDGTLHMAFFGNALASDTLCPSLLGVIGTAVFREEGLFDAIYVGSSDDGGATWTFHVESKCTHDFAEQTKPGRFVGGNFLPTIAVDTSDDSVHVAFPFFELAQNRYTIRYIRSTDGGATWTDPVDVTPSATEDARMPTIHADGGVVRLAYLISRDADNTGDAAYVESADGGATWTSRILLTSEPWLLEDDPDLGDYIDIDVAGGRMNVVWTDARNGPVTEIWSRGASILEASS